MLVRPPTQTPSCMGPSAVPSIKEQQDALWDQEGLNWLTQLSAAREPRLHNSCDFSLSLLSNCHSRSYNVPLHHFPVLPSLAAMSSLP